ncbi:MAG: hypothetical protein A2798_01685 [Candidatus Levybacteria bacterium RIFCSPHIGHO2_01_FULL_37_17]|nr:MAG: hypothetical protein A2798_01685 [Candidatus Levybacteria bacterium RIFCSPHIGHO2_01_FULL_37_17]OGH37160.1 MAG: hypothetical protein A2959_02545 [Candidatus Levybacteria bacterium RIFCSPLOWO2_01_FULL_38_23]
MTKDELQGKLKESMLAKDELKTSVLRMLLSAINYYEIQKGGAGYSATEEDVLSVIQSQAKQRRDSITEYEKAQRQDLADKEKKELEILQEYLPEQMGEEEIQKVVEQIINEVGASAMQDMGKVMGALNAKLKGKADMGLVSKLVSEKLTS